MKQRSRFLSMLFAALVLGGEFVYGQLINGSMVGRVTDPSGGAVPDAKVTVKNVDTGGESYANTDTSGIARRRAGERLHTRERPHTRIAAAVTRSAW